jgi:hypothetical protein
VEAAQVSDTTKMSSDKKACKQIKTFIINSVLPVCQDFDKVSSIVTAVDKSEKHELPFGVKFDI